MIKADIREELSFWQLAGQLLEKTGSEPHLSPRVSAHTFPVLRTLAFEPTDPRVKLTCSWRTEP